MNIMGNRMGAESERDFSNFTGESDFLSGEKNADAIYRDSAVSQQDLINKKLVGIRSIRYEFPQYSNF